MRRQSGFAGRYDPADEDDLWRDAELRNVERWPHHNEPSPLWPRLPRIVKLIVVVFGAACGVIVTAIAWLIAGGIDLLLRG